MLPNVSKEAQEGQGRPVKRWQVMEAFPRDSLGNPKEFSEETSPETYPETSLKLPRNLPEDFVRLVFPLGFHEASIRFPLGFH